MKVENAKIFGMKIKPGDKKSKKPGIELSIGKGHRYHPQKELKVLINLEHAEWLNCFSDSDNYEHVAGSYIRIVIDKDGIIQAVGDIFGDIFIPVNDFLTEENKSDEYCLNQLMKMENLKTK